MSKFKVVVLDKILMLSDVERNELAKINAEVIQVSCNTPEEVWEAAGDADAVIQIYTKMTEEAISGLKNCKVIAHCGIGLDSVDIPAATKAGIVVTNVPQYCQQEVATMAMGLLLNVARGIKKCDATVREGNWHQALRKVEHNRSFVGKTIGLVGFGSIARYVTTMAQAFGMNVIAYDAFMNEQLAKDLNVKSATLEYVLQNSDYISLHCPYMKETHHIIGAEQIAMMKDGAILINTARGALVDQTALTAALQSGHLAGAGMDVMEVEPPQMDDPIFRLENVVITGHTAAATVEAFDTLRLRNCESIVSVLSGAVPKFIANKDVLEKLNLK